MNRKQIRPDAHEDLPFPVPTKTIPADESASPYQSDSQRRVELLAGDLTHELSRKLGMSRREFLGSSCGMAVVFMAMNSVFGEFFSVNRAEAADPAIASERQKALAGQFIFDVQTHCVGSTYAETWLLGLRERAKQWNPELKGERTTLDELRFDNYYREVYDLSDTKIALLSSAPNDDPKKWFIRNDEIAKIREIVNQRAGRKALYSHAVFTPGHPGWMEHLDRDIHEFKPDGWKGYTVGTPFEESRYPWRLDDEKLVYPAFEKMVKAGITNVCIHKGLLPVGYQEKMPTTWEYGKINDLDKAAKDWPQLNFLIYHSAMRSGDAPSAADIGEFEASGHIPWITELAGIAERTGVKNVYAELGGTFAMTAISAPKYCAGILGTLIKGLGADHVLWGTDSVFLGSPQWQIEAFRRLEIPEEMRKRFGFAALGSADGGAKELILGRNAAKLFKAQS
ncbi:MAG: amidohydrolase family protein [Desulfomonile tiedjei]|nr:amidohydrolase family protein [Desulfomonile tiedjei]